MIFVELIVNRPIRRSFRQADPPPPVDPAADDEALSIGADEQHPNLATYLDTFHYHVPLELEPMIQPGHLVWAPFGGQQVQGVVVRLADSAPVPTRPLLRLARPEPVLTAAQVTVAIWIAAYYVTPVAEALKLFLPPGLLSKTDGRATARAKRNGRFICLPNPMRLLLNWQLWGARRRRSSSCVGFWRSQRGTFRLLSYRHTVRLPMPLQFTPC